ncbi:MAG: phospholipid carrier-dependent glycosyltransferase [Acidobacteria bacterium]|nr:phospholipid carrier-dependent glycosyltransferase [Acidobacteriota bacterium]
MTQRMKTALPMAAVLALAFGLRLYGLGFGLPMLSNLYVRPDESLLVIPAVRFFETAGNPASLDYPLLLIALNAAVFQMYFLLAGALGLTQAASLPADFVRDGTPYWLLARGLSVVAATLTVLLVYRMARRITSRGAALLAALLYATAPLAVRDGHFATTDNLLTLLVTAALYAALRWLEGAPRALPVAALLLGLAVSTKYAAWLLLPALLAAALLVPVGPKWKRLATVLLIPAAVFAVVNFYALARWGEFTWLLGRILRVFYLHQPGDAAWTLGSAFRQVFSPLFHGPGQLVGLALCAVGLAWPSTAAGSRSKKIVLAVAMFSFLAAIFLFRHWVPYRYVLPVLPVVAVFSARGIFELARKPALAMALGLLVAAPGLWKSVQLDRLLAREDTRNQAQRWIQQNVPRDVPIVILGGPECEVQVLETPASLERRSEYVTRLYGPRAGKVVSEPYRLQMRDASRIERGYEVYRNPEKPPPGRQVLLVAPAHPLRMARVDPAALRPYQGREGPAVTFESLSGDWPEFEFDGIDAFFLPWNRLGRVQRPGPHLRLTLVGE